MHLKGIYLLVQVSYGCMYTHLHVLTLQPQTLSNFLMFPAGNSWCQNVEEPCRVDAKLSRRPFTTKCPSTRGHIVQPAKKETYCQLRTYFQTWFYTYCIRYSALLQERFLPIHTMLRKLGKLCLLHQEVFCSLHVTTAVKITQNQANFSKLYYTYILLYNTKQ